jgi:hypothetical protein
MKRRNSYAVRDQAPSGFAAPLGRLCDALPAVAAAIVDPEGETVDYAGYVEPFGIKLAAAEVQLVMGELQRSRFPGWENTREVVVRASGTSFAGIRLGDGYSLVIQLGYRAFSFSRRALNEAVRELCAEGELALPSQFRVEEWLRVDVQDDGSELHRPNAVWLASRWMQLQVLGRYMSAELQRREVGYRVRLDDGQEATLVRERLGRWYADRLLPH